MPNPSSRQSNKVLPTPKVADLLFFELVESTRFAPKGTTFPYAYGTTYAALHSNSTLFPNHKLVLVEDADEQGLWIKMWYAADRNSQDDYNYTILYPFANNTRYFQISREYILPRGEQPLELGSADPGNPFGTVTVTYVSPSGETYVYTAGGVTGYVYTTSTVGESSGAVLVAQSEQPLEYDSKISSLYVRVTRIYQKIPGSDDTVPGSGAGQSDDGYTVTRPLGTDSFFRLVWKLTLPRSVADNYKSTDYKPCIIPGYTNLLLVDEKIEASNENNQSSTVTRTYEGNITGAPFPSADRVFYQGKFYPGTMPPDKFIVSKRRVKTTVITQGSEYENVNIPTEAPEQNSPPLRDALESVEATPSNDSPSLLGTKDIVYWTDVEVATLSGEQWDNNLRDMVDYTTFVVPSDEVGDLGDPAVGTQREITPLSTGWSLVVVMAPRETEIENLANPFVNIGTSPRNYLDYINDYWPNVLYALQTVFSPDGSQIALDYEFRPRAYSGPCLCCKQVAWSKSAPLININPTLQVQFLDPTSLSLRWPGVISDSIPECLHYNPIPYDPPAAVPGSYVFTGPLGTDYFKEWIPTSFPTWPDFYVKRISVEPYLGGWWITKLTVQKPSVGNVSS